MEDLARAVDKLAHKFHAVLDNPADAIVCGCVCYSSSIPGIWEGMRQYFLSVGVPFDVVLFTTYDRQVEALLNGSIDIAWNGPMAHVRTQKRTMSSSFSLWSSFSLGCRDADIRFAANLVVRKDSAINALEDLSCKRLATGTYDSPQAYVLPLHAMPKDLLRQVHVIRFDRDLGKHGDTAAGELEVIRALVNGEVEAGLISAYMYAAASAADKEKLKIISGVVPPFNHCMFDARPGLSPDKRAAFSKALNAMSMSNPDQAKVMKQEGITKEWVAEPSEAGWDAMRDALAEEPNVPFPPPLDTPAKHRFASLEVRTIDGFPAKEFVRSCTSCIKRPQELS